MSNNLEEAIHGERVLRQPRRRTSLSSLVVVRLSHATPLLILSDEMTIRMFVKQDLALVVRRRVIKSK